MLSISDHNLHKKKDDAQVKPIVSIIILAHNQLEYTRKCIESIFKHTKLPFELILIDNGSTDDTWAYMESLPESKSESKKCTIKLIRNKENLGFAGGNNQGIAVSNGEYVLLLNNDTLVTTGWLGRMIACAKAHPESGIIGPVSNHVSGPQLTEKVNYNTASGGGLNKFSRKFSAKHKGKIKKVLRVVGFCMLIKQEVIKKIGGLDERFGKGNFEDDDFSIRAALAGFESWVAEDCFIHHFGSKTFSGIKIDYRASLENNWQIFKKKWGLPDELPYGSGYAIPQGASEAFDPKRYYIPLPEVSPIMSTEGIQANSYENNQIDGLSSSEEYEHDTETIDSGTGNIPQIIEKTINLVHKGFADRAVKILLKAIKSIKENKDLVYCLADILLDEKQYTQALEILDKMPEEKGAIKYMEIKASCELALGKDSVAEETADMMLANKTISPVAFFIKGKLAINCGKVDEAGRYLTEATGADKSFGPAWSYLGLIEKNNGSTVEALDLMEKGFSLSPVDKEALTFYYNEALHQKTFEKAEKVFKEVLFNLPEHKLINFRIIDLMLRQEKYEEAMEKIQKAIVTYGIDDGIIAAALSIKEKIPQGMLDLGKKKGTLSACMIVKNEEHNMGKCLLNLKSLVDEIILVDTGSSDRTKSLAEIYGAKVYNFEWNNDFSKARNYSLSKATGSWILIVDADEIISPVDHAILKKLINKNIRNSRAFSFVTRNYQTLDNIIGLNPNHGDYKEETGYGWIPSKKVRLFRNNFNIKFEYHVHELVEPSLKRNKIKVEECPIPVHHYGNLNYGKRLKKEEEYYRLGSEKLYHSPKNAKSIFEHAIQAGVLKKWEQAIELMQEHNKICSDNPAAYAYTGHVYHKLRNIDMAIGFTEKALKMEPENSDYLCNYALFQIFRGKAELSIPVFNRLIKKYPYHHSYRVKFAVACACTGAIKKASQILEELKNTSIAPSLLKSFTKIIKELTSFNQHGYARHIISMMEPLLINKSIEGNMPETSSLKKSAENTCSDLYAS